MLDIAQRSSLPPFIPVALPTMRALIYARVSQDQTGEGRSVTRQVTECLRLVEYKRWTLVSLDGKEYIEDNSISAYGTSGQKKVSRKRPGWERVLQAIERGEVDVIVAWHLDRLTRNMADLERLILLCEEHNVSVTTATGDIDLTNDTGRMIARILAAVARQEVERKAARQRLSHNVRRSEGRVWTAVKCLGYDSEGNVIKKEADAIRKAVKDVLEEGRPLKTIGQEWAHFPSPRREPGKPWTPTGVRGVLLNPRITGLVASKAKDNSLRWDVANEGNWEPIISREDFARINEALASPSRNLIPSERRSQGATARNLLTSVIECGVCGSPAEAASKVWKRKDGPVHAYTYKCPNRHTSVPRDEADQLVLSAISSTLAITRPGAILPSGATGPSEDELGSRIRDVMKRQETLVSTFTKGIIGAEVFEPAAESLAAELASLQQAHEGALDEVHWAKIRAQATKDFLALSVKDQRRTLKEISRITMQRVNKGSTSSAAKQVTVEARMNRGPESHWVIAYQPETQKAPHSEE